MRSPINGYANKPLSYYSRKPRVSKRKPPVPREKFGLIPFQGLSLIELQLRFDALQSTIESLSLAAPQRWAFERIRLLQEEQDKIRKARDWFNPSNSESLK